MSNVHVITSDGQQTDHLFHSVVGVPDCDRMLVTIFTVEAIVDFGLEKFCDREPHIFDGAQNWGMRRKPNLELFEFVMSGMNETATNKRTFGAAELSFHKLEPLGNVIPHRVVPSRK